ncbi:MAG: protein kinase [Planctomycetaceae bacterium]|nr:protein kinase [Planctomycetaceae bacterium]
MATTSESESDLSDSDTYPAHKGEERPDPVALAAEAFLASVRRGETPSIEDYCARSPENQVRLRRVLSTLLLMEQHGDSTRSPGSSESLDPLLNRRELGDYRILKRIGRGGMGIVFDAVHKVLGRRVALKVMYASETTDSKPCARFQREARVTARLHHTNIVPLFELGHDEGTVYHAMQLIDGPGLDELLYALRRHRDRGIGSEMNEAVKDSEHTLILDCITQLYVADRRGYFNLVAGMMLQAAEALAHAHHRGVLHRDIKPSNLLIDDQQHLWVTDFGLAKSEEDAVTRSGDLAGTLRYMAPERFSGSCDRRSDVYSLGVTSYELLALEPAFPDSDRAVLIQSVMQQSPKSLRSLQPMLPVDLETIVLTAMHPDRDMRYPTAERFAEDLRSFLEDRPVSARRAGVLERSWRWCRRNRVFAVLLATIVVAFLIVSWQWRDAVESRRTAEKATASESAAKEQARRLADRLQDEAIRMNRSLQFLEEARWLADQRQWDDAIHSCDAAIELRPDMPAAIEERAVRFRELGLFAEALRDLETALSIKRPVLSSKWTELALLQAYAGHTEQCRKTFDSMVSIFGAQGQTSVMSDILKVFTLLPASQTPDIVPVAMAETVSAREGDVRSRFRLAWCYARSRQFADADNLCRELLPRSSDVAVTGSLHALRAIIAMEMSDVELAKRELEQAQSERSDGLDLLLQSADSKWVKHYGANASWPMPVEDWLAFLVHLRIAEERVQGKASRDVRLNLLRARGLAALRRMDDAIREYDQVLTDSVEKGIRLEAIRAMGFQKVEHGKYGEAAILYRQAVDLSPEDPSLWRFLAVACLADRNLSEYRNVCESMIQKFKGTSSTDSALCVLEVCISNRQGCPDWAQLEPFAELAESHQSDSVRFVAAWHMRMQRPEDAVRELEELETFCGLRGADLLVLSAALDQVGRKAEASVRLEQAITWIQLASEESKRALSSENRPRWGSWTEIPETMSLLNELAPDQMPLR